MIGRLAGAAAILSLAAASIAQGATVAAAPDAEARTPRASLKEVLSAEIEALGLVAGIGDPLAGGVDHAKKRGGGGHHGGFHGGGRRGGAKVRGGGHRRYGSGGHFRGGNRVTVNKTVNRRGGWYGPRGGRYYDDDDNEAAAAIIGGVVGLGVGAAIAGSGSSDYTCVDNDRDGECDIY